MQTFRFGLNSVVYVGGFENFAFDAPFSDLLILASVGTGLRYPSTGRAIFSN